MIIGRKGQYPTKESPNVIRRPGFEKRAMPAIVENDEDSDQKRARQNRQRRGDPPGDRDGVIHHQPKQRVRDQRVNKLPGRSGRGWLLVLDNYPFPLTCVRLGFPEFFALIHNDQGCAPSLLDKGSS